MVDIEQRIVLDNKDIGEIMKYVYFYSEMPEKYHPQNFPMSKDANTMYKRLKNLQDPEQVLVAFRKSEVK